MKFPFRARRQESDDEDFLAAEEMRGRIPFPYECEVDVLGIWKGDFAPDCEGVMMEVRGDKRCGCNAIEGTVPLQDFEVIPKSDPNYWPVREFAVWYANR